MWAYVALVFVLCGMGEGKAWASLTVLVGEPFGPFGTMMPVGHMAIYLDRVCADGPLKLRMCEAGEPQGVAIARYHRIGDLDWVASPIMQFLYATDRAEDVLAYATAESVWEMRQRYRRRFLLAIVPDGAEKDKATDEWWETAGVAYNRRVWGYRIATSREQDERFVATMNARPNKHLYHLKKTNCADFAAEMVNLYFPGLVHNDRIGDFGLMTPKEVARCVAAYGKEHPLSDFRVMEIPQVPGSLRRSRPVRGGAEAGLKTKRYLFTLAVIQPEVPIGLTVLYLWHGRWKIGQGAELAGPGNFVSPVEQAVGTKEGCVDHGRMKKRPCFLVIDREFAGSISTRKLLIETAKFNVITAYSGTEAIETVERFPAVNGVVLDASLGDMECDELIGELKRIAPEVPTISIEGGARTCERADYNVPSFDPAKLLEVLRGLQPKESDAIDRRDEELNLEAEAEAE